MHVGLREGEISALHAEDIVREKSIIHVTKSQARTDTGKYIIKQPKTVGSVRDVPVPRWIIDELPVSGKIVDLNAGQISARFVKLAGKIDGDFNFHSLRKYSASTKIAMGISLETVKAWHGWGNDYTALKTYVKQVDSRVQQDKELFFANVKKSG